MEPIRHLPFGADELDLICKHIEIEQGIILSNGIKFFPEKPSVILNQISRVLMGLKRASLMHRFALDQVPGDIIEWIEQDEEDLNAIEIEDGFLLFNNSLLEIEDVLESLVRDEIGFLLGYGISGVPKRVEDTVVIRLMDKNGLEKEAVSAYPEQHDVVVEALLGQFEEGDDIEIQRRSDFYVERLAPFKKVFEENPEGFHSDIAKILSIFANN